MVKKDMSNQKSSKKHHYIPRFYLKKFTNNHEFLYVLDKSALPESRYKLLPINNIGYESNMYKYKNIDGVYENLESTFSKMEGTAAKIIRKIENKKHLSLQDKSDLSIFLINMWVRVPQAREEIKRRTQEILNSVSQMYLSTMATEKMQGEILKITGKFFSETDIKDLKNFATDSNRSKIDVHFNEDYWIKHMLHLCLELHPALQLMNWEFVVSKKSYDFITSDNPFLLTFNPGLREKCITEYVGLLTPGTQKIFPLSGNICLIMSEPSEKPTLVYTDAGTDFAKMINKCIMKNSYRFVYSNSKRKFKNILKEYPECLISSQKNNNEMKKSKNRKSNFQ